MGFVGPMCWLIYDTVILGPALVAMLQKGKAYVKSAGGICADLL